MNVYLLSGLGADYRAFQNLKIPDYTCIHITYPIPFPRESLSAYAQRVIEQIDTSKPFALVGLSFGGILSMEMLAFIRPTKTILISSITNKNELPLLYRLAGRLRLHQLIPPKKVNKPNFLTYWIFGIKQKKEKELLAQILTSTHTQFSKWAVHEILHWNRKNVPHNIYRIHGTKDRLLPIKNFTPDYIIKGGGHLLVLQYGEAVSKMVVEILSN